MSETTNNVALTMTYNLEHIKWKRSNKKCLIVTKTSIIVSIRGAILECQSDIEYLNKIQQQFTDF
ncbi:hypothetical protein Zm00014a_019488 [Zea mays]|uniref:Uncharacterized protein n=1 Tax=Zea mays TaxID=4577 RepID=A0A3L6E281_MAIZE|nr:hypothetical protein Zm00014a_019488 [Zea mays]